MATFPTQNSILRISDEKTMELIELYEKEECLWNTSLAVYKARDLRSAAAEKIAKKLNIVNFDSRHVMIKFKNLRNSYCQELKKIAKSASAGCVGDDLYRPKVFWFDKMNSFLRPHVQTSRWNLLSSIQSDDEKGIKENKDTESTIVKRELESEGSSNEDWTIQRNPEIEDIQQEYQSSDDETVLKVKRPRLDSEAGGATHRLTNPQPETSRGNDPVSTQLLKTISLYLEMLTSQKDDPFDSFGKYIASLLKNMPTQKALDLQPKIVSMITKAALSNCELRVSQSDE